jgi:hypothetical protein
MPAPGILSIKIFPKYTFAGIQFPAGFRFVSCFFLTKKRPASEEAGL